MNQTVVFDNKICDYINYILRASQFNGCSLRDVSQMVKLVHSAINETHTNLEEYHYELVIRQKRFPVYKEMDICQCQILYL